MIRDRVVNLFYADNGPEGQAPDGVEEILEALRAVPPAGWVPPGRVAAGP